MCSFRPSSDTDIPVGTSAQAAFGGEKLTRLRLPEIPGVQCITFDPTKLTVEEIQNGPKLEGGLHWLFGSSELRRSREDIRLVLRIIQYYHMNASCWLDDALHGFHFMLADGRAPLSVRAGGALVGEECGIHHLRNLRVVEFRKKDFHFQTDPLLRFRIEDPSLNNEWMYSFASKAAADSAFAIMQRFGFTTDCDAVDRVTGRKFFHYLMAR